MSKKRFEFPDVDFEICKKAVECFGIKAQTDMLIEEMSELTQALLKLRRYTDTVDDIKKELLERGVCEEIADVLIVLAQIMNYGDYSPMVDALIYYKTARLIKNIEDLESRSENE